MKQLLCDTGVLIAVYDQDDMYHARCIDLLGNWDGRLLVPEPVLGETCNFLRNHVRNGAALEVQFLDVLTASEGDFDIVNPVADDRTRATELARQLVTRAARLRRQCHPGDGRAPEGAGDSDG